MRPEATGSASRAATAAEPCVIVPLDGTREALAALPVARVLAALEGATVQIVHVSERDLSPRDLLERVGLGPEETTGSVLQARTGSPAEEICRVVSEREGSSVVMCVRTGRRRVGRELGSVARAVLGGAHARVVFVPPEPRLAPFALRRIVFPHDGAPGKADALDAATRLARGAKAELLVLHVVAATSAGEEAGTFPPPFYVDQPQHEWPAWTREFLDRLCCGCEEGPRTALGLLLLRGDPADALVGYVTGHQVDLLVLGWRGSVAPERASVVRSLVARAPCPVLVVRLAA